MSTIIVQVDKNIFQKEYLGGSIWVILVIQISLFSKSFSEYLREHSRENILECLFYRNLGR